ncbi:anaerobic glycerol-3-phosphate dehydrogenase subunit B [Halorientalis sp. IM1011]|uniref:glycerol-3-phosphate dehydrogenase subunit GlpB n=1 Tax=Halorientalis sp. IM1011 TaxID=1932360 RepID=UPI00097CCA75|nr:glycerol-3-phosphate dehydrogenase subunit GlpB [Halorientalis sp. IM1011]AQL44554.1 anaerobic glycerol-3-phosphate dehydrogenase subunit B [Halorientalis sp. IM1011]
MAIEQDVLVIGGGLAGATAAISAARTGADVRLVSSKQPTLRHASGLIDVLGYTPDGEGPLADPFAALSDLPEGHPYERVGRDAVEAGLALFDEIVGNTYEGNHTERNALIPTQGGRVKPTARYPASVSAGLASDERDALLVGFERLAGFDASLSAARLNATGVPFTARGAAVEFPELSSADPKVTRFAQLLDRDEGVDAGRGVRREVTERVTTHMDGEDRVGFPAVLGDDHPEEVRADLESHLGAAVFEIPMGPPSLPGLRLEDRLYDALDEAGVRIETGNPVVGYESKSRGNGVETVLVDRTGSTVPYGAEQFVLATGGLVGKGIESDRSGVEEPIFDCHVAHPSDRYDWFADDAFGDHRFARFGVDPDRELRPRDAHGKIEFDNLRAAGAVLGNYDFAAEKSGSGVSLATGSHAGRLAGENT